MSKASSAARATGPWDGTVACGLRLAVLAVMFVLCNLQGRVLMSWKFKLSHEGDCVPESLQLANALRMA